MRSFRYSAVLSMLALATLPGCGTRTYEGRVAQTAEYFGYLSSLDEQLSSTWSNNGISMRLPKGFSKLPTGADFIDVSLPGVAGAWEMSMSADVDGANATRPAYLYIMTNRGMLNDPKESANAADFKSIAVASIVQALRAPAPTPNQWAREKFPRAQGFSQQKNYTTYSFQPEEKINDTQVEVTIYLHDVGEVQTVIVLMTPVGGANARFNDAMSLALETLKVDPRSSGGSSNSGSGSGSGSGGGGEGGRRSLGGGGGERRGSGPGF